MCLENFHAGAPWLEVELKTLGTCGVNINAKTAHRIRFACLWLKEKSSAFTQK